MQMPNCFNYLWFFVDAGENLVMANDVTTPLNPPVAPIEEEKLEEAPLDVNVSQRLCEEEPSREWCALQLIVWYGIVKCLLTHMPWQSI
jgi:hypothetical protein